MLEVIFFKTSQGRVPVLEWLRELPVQDRRQIGLDLLRVQENWPLGMPLCKSLGKGLWEVRSTLPGGRIARVIFCLQGSTVFVLNGFYKTSQKAPQAELALALKRKKEIEA